MDRPSPGCGISCSCCLRSQHSRASASTPCSTGSRRTGDGLRRALLRRSALAFVWDGATLARLHPYENLSYNALVGGLPGAYRRYDMDYWFNSMPEAIHRLEAYLREKTPLETSQAPKIYSVAVCGIQLSFDRTVTLPQLHWDFRSEWDESEFFIAPTHMNCDRDLDGDIVATVERFGVPIAYVKDRRKIVKLPMATAASPPSAQDVNRKEN